MWLAQSRGSSYRVFLNLLAFSFNNIVKCNAIANSSFNENIRNYLVHENANSTVVKTLQKHEPGRYAILAPVRNPIRFKEIPDNTLSGSTHSRGLLHHEHSGKISRKAYGLHDYEEGHYGYDYHDNHGYGHHYGHHDLDHDDHHHGLDHHHGHHDDHHGHHHTGYGHHHKHYDHHALAAKAVLWPIAGIALLGAAAALVSNPVLLQLGVATGRRRRDTAEIPNNYLTLKRPDFSYKDISTRKVGDVSDELKHQKEVLKRVLKKFPIKSPVKITFLDGKKYAHDNGNRFIPIPLILKNK